MNSNSCTMFILFTAILLSTCLAGNNKLSEQGTSARSLGLSLSKPAGLNSPALSGVEGSKPNIVFIMTDDLGYGDISCYNPESKINTPNIDNLAKQGIKFTDAHSPSAVCTPTRYGLLTGRYAWRGSLKSGVIEGPHVPLLEDGRPTIASMLQEHGYVTGAFGKWHLGMTFQGENGEPAKVEYGKWQVDIDFTKDITDGPVQHGFNYSSVSPGCPTDDFFNFWVENNVILGPVELSEERKWMQSPGWKHEDVDTLITSRAMSFIKNHVTTKPDVPFFAYIPLSVPHIPWLPPEFTKGKSGAGLRGDQVVLADWCVAQVDQLLQELNVAGNTIFIFTSDNGPRDGVNGHKSSGKLRGQKGEVWEGGHRIPFIVRWPGNIQPNTISEELICLTDMMATFSALVGNEMPDNSGEDSFNILPVLLGKELSGPVRSGIINHSGQGVFCIREGDWKLIVDCDKDGYLTKIEADEKGQLFNLAVDPYEQINLIEKKPEIVKGLKVKLDKYKQQGYTRNM